MKINSEHYMPPCHSFDDYLKKKISQAFETDRTLDIMMQSIQTPDEKTKVFSLEDEGKIKEIEDYLRSELPAQGGPSKVPSLSKDEERGFSLEDEAKIKEIEDYLRSESSAQGEPSKVPSLSKDKERVFSLEDEAKIKEIEDYLRSESPGEGEPRKSFHFLNRSISHKSGGKRASTPISSNPIKIPKCSDSSTLASKKKHPFVVCKKVRIP